MLGDPLGTLRGLLGEEPSRAHWEEIWRLFARWDDDEARQAGIAYAQEHLKGWPAHLLAPPERKSSDNGAVECTTKDWQLALLNTLILGGRAALFSLLKARQTPLWGLQLSDVIFAPGDFHKLAAMPVLQSLVHLHFCNGNWHEHLTELRECGLLSQVSSIGFSGINEEEDKAPGAALRALLCTHKALTHVTHLEISHGFLQYETTYDLFRGTEGLLQQIETLSLARVFNFASFETFLIGMSDGALPRLKTLNLARNESITRLRGESSPMMFFKPSRSIESFDMSNTSFSDSGWDYLMDVFQEEPELQLRALYLSGIRIEEAQPSDEDEPGFDGGGRKINLNDLWALPGLFGSDWMTHLQVLHVANNDLNNRSISALARNEALQQNLQELNLSDNRFTLTALSEISKRLKALEILILQEGYNSKLPPAVCAKWLQDVPLPPRFRTLYYDYPFLSEAQRETLLALAAKKGIRLVLC